MRVGVIGCGLIGAAVARELALRGVSVVIYEMGRPGEGTSGTTFAWVNSHNKGPREYHELNVAGIQAHVELQAASRSGPQWFVQTGNLVWAVDSEGAARLAERRARLASLGYPVQELSVEAAQQLEPAVRFDGAESVWLFPAEGYVLPLLLLRRLLDEALERGATLRSGTQVEGVELVPGGARLRLGDGSVDRVDVAVCCAGRWSGEILARARYSLPMVAPVVGSEAVGYLAFTHPAAVELGRVLTSPRLHVRPDGDGRLVLQAPGLDSQADPAADAPEADGPVGREFARRAAKVLRGGAGLTLSEIRVGQRALPADGLSVVGHLDDDARLYAVVTHSGVTLAPLLGRLATEEIVSRVRASTLRPFRPGRLLERERVEGIEPS